MSILRLLATALMMLFAMDSAAAATRRPVSPVQYARAAEAVRSLVSQDPDQALRQTAQLAEMAERVSPRPQDAMAEASWLTAEAQLQVNRPDLARRLADRGLAQLGEGGNPDVRANLLLTRGRLLLQDGNVARALTDFQNAFAGFARAGNLRGQSRALILLATLYREAADYQRSLSYLGQAIELEDDDPNMLIALFNNRGNVLSDMHRYVDAIPDFQRALSQARATNDRLTQTRILSNLARAQRRAGMRGQATASIERALALIPGNADQEARVRLGSLAARIALDGGRKAEARERIGRAFQGIDLSETTLAQRDNHANAYAIYRALGDTGMALRHLEALDRLDSQAAALTTSTKAGLLAAQFDFQNQELRIARLKAEELRRSVEFERAGARLQRLLFYAIGGSVAVLVGLLTFGIVTVGRNRNEIRLANTRLTETNVALQRALAAKTEFLATTSHEIRTPLNGILGMTQVMLADRALAPDLRDRLGVVHGAGVTMRALVDDILDVAKMETGALSLEDIPADLSATVTEVVRLWEEQARARGLSLSLAIGEAPDWIRTDPARLRQILFNLLSNAMKFTAAGEIVVAVTATADARLRIAVRDSGIGIPADKQEQVFESFSQADASTTRRFGGTGLGLTICRNLARAMGGDILLESREGEGSTFTLDLPLRPAAAPQAVVPAASGALLVLERNPIACGMLRALFKAEGTTLAFVDDAQDLLARLREGGARALLIDEASVRASGGDPLATLGAIGEAARASGTPGVLLWADPDTQVEALATAAGIRLLAKPVSGKALMSVMYENFSRTGGEPLAAEAA